MIQTIQQLKFQLRGLINMTEDKALHHPPVPSMLVGTNSCGAPILVKLHSVYTNTYLPRPSPYLAAPRA